jgi:hypothetical protein
VSSLPNATKRGMLRGLPPPPVDPQVGEEIAAGLLEIGRVFLLSPAGPGAVRGELFLRTRRTVERTVIAESVAVDDAEAAMVDGEATRTYRAVLSPSLPADVHQRLAQAQALVAAPALGPVQ